MATSTATATPTATSPANTNLILNGDFESGVFGWSTWQARAIQAAGGHSGQFAARVAWTDPGVTGDAAKSYTFDNWPGAAPNPTPGETYSAMAWVRADTGTVGKQIWIVLRAHTGDGANAEWMYSAPLVLADGWQRIGVQITITRADLKNVDVILQSGDGVDGDAFLVDDVTMWRGTLPADVLVTVTPVAGTPGPAVRPGFQAAAPVIVNGDRAP